MSSRRQALEGLKPDNGTNAGLWLEKCLPDVEKGGPGRQEHFEDLDKIEVSAEYRRFFQRWKDSMVALGAQTAEATVAGRMVVGLGAESVLETSIALHRTYGVPYIPGSALKGLTAATAHKHQEDPEWRKVKEDGETGSSHLILFGDQESSGYVTFHDALWIPEGDRLPLDLDVMTVHHPNYYQGKDGAPPADWDSPTPVAFVSARGRYLLALTGPVEWTEAAMKILVEALREDGIGAKTAAGYGRMSVPRKAEPEKVNWKPMIQGLGFGNAGDAVPKVLKLLRGADRQEAAGVILGLLGRKEVKKRQEKDWARQLLEAAGASGKC
jgi:CRISPR-associated protein Cmr6